MMDIVQEIEIRLDEYMKTIKYIHDENKNFMSEVHDKVAKRRELKANEVRERNSAERKKKNAELQIEMQEKLNRKVKKIGKPIKGRSEKPKIKQTVKKKIIDEDTQD